MGNLLALVSDFLLMSKKDPFETWIRINQRNWIVDETLYLYR
jgi:hypothetical protein